MGSADSGPLGRRPGLPFHLRASLRTRSGRLLFGSTEGFYYFDPAAIQPDTYSPSVVFTSLRAFTSAYPKHRRVSYANNLIGRSLLDKGDARGAAQVLLGNYRTNPAGERAPDSLFYLGQALMKLGQPGQACKAYQELDAVYGAKVRPDLKKLEADGKAAANCS